jgi:hypothetical protein
MGYVIHTEHVRRDDVGEEERREIGPHQDDPVKMPLGANQLYDDSTRFTATAASHARAGANAHRVSAAALPGGPRRSSSAAVPAASGRVTERRTKDRSALQTAPPT